MKGRKRAELSMTKVKAGGTKRRPDGCSVAEEMSGKRSKDRGGRYKEEKKV